MLVSPQFYSFGNLLDDHDHDHDPTNHKQEDMSCFSRERADTLPLNNGDFGCKSNDGSLDGDGDKKLDHNARERDRRKRMNTLYENLRSLLPPHQQSKNMKIPATISRVLKYIPELQKEVKRLKQSKERFMSKKSMMAKSRSSNSAASAVQINEDEVLTQISIPKYSANIRSFSEAILKLEDEGFLMLNVSCFESFEGRLFINLHFQAQEGQVIDVEKLKEKVCSLI